MINEAVRNGNGNLQEDLQQALKAFLFNRTRRRPMIFVTLSRI
jgi:mRNA degradation ribonuclease J1/J2